MSNKLQQVGSFGATGTTDWQRADSGLFNLDIDGTFVATIQLQRSYDKGTTSFVVGEFTGADAPLSQTGEASNANLNENINNDRTGAVLYRLECTAYTSGTANYALTQ